MGEFHQHRIAGGEGDAAARALHHRRVVGGFGVGRPAGVGVQQWSKAEGLRGLSPPEARARHGLGGAVLGLGALEGVGDGEGGDRAVGAGQGVQQGLQMRPGDEGPGGVVDQDDFVRSRVERLEAGKHRLGPRAAADGRRPAEQSGQRLVRQGLATVGHNHDQLARAGGEQGFGGPADHRPAGQVAPLLGAAGTGPAARSSRDNYGDKFHGAVFRGSNVIVQALRRCTICLKSSRVGCL